MVLFVEQKPRHLHPCGMQHGIDEIRHNSVGTLLGLIVLPLYQSGTYSSNGGIHPGLEFSYEQLASGFLCPPSESLW
jgi:hypothetical protein